MEMLLKKRNLLYCLLALILSLQGIAMAKPGVKDYYPDEADPLVGNYEGRWSADKDVNPAISAQVTALGRDTYQVRIANKLFMRCPPMAIVDVTAKNGKLVLGEGQYQGVIENGVFTGKEVPGKSTFTMKKVVHKSPTLGAKAPDGGIVLFDGSNLDAWDGTEGWELLPNGVMMVTPDGGYISSKQKFKDVKLHVEFRLSHMPKDRGQGRSNSGVFVQDMYEVQILDSFGLEGYYNECGALYKVAAPMVNACLPPLDWQTYDITFRAARFNAAGELTENPRITVLQNGKLIHNDQELWWLTTWKEEGRLKPHVKEAGPIKFQGHNNYVQFRNVWVVDMGK